MASRVPGEEENFNQRYWGKEPRLLEDEIRAGQKY